MEVTGSTELRGEFINLLITQLQNQNPLEPVDQQQFLGQLAQFSTLEEMESLNTSFSQMLQLSELTQGASLLGKEAVLTSVDNSGRNISGFVDSVRVVDGGLRLTINNNEYSLDEVSSLRSAA